jgi:hypothetical protein
MAPLWLAVGTTKSVGESPGVEMEKLGLTVDSL